MIKVSVVVPVYNVEKYLSQCIESILSQTLKDIEVICVNDGSKDSSLDILRDFSKKDSRVIVIDKENSGYGDTMNIGLSAANGEYVSIVESDDFIDKKMLEDLYDLAKKQDCDVVKSDWFNYWTKNNLSLKAGKIPHNWTNKVFTALEYPDILCIQPSLWSGLYKKSFLEENGIKFLTTPGASYQDTSFNFKVFCLAKKIALTDKAYVYYRQDNPSSSINDKNKTGIIFKEYDEINSFIDENKSVEFFIAQKLMNEYKAYRWTLKRIAEPLRMDFVSQISERFNEYDQKYSFDELNIKKSIKDKIKLLVVDSSVFFKDFEKEMKKEKWKEFRRNLISVKINSSRCIIKLFGIQIVNIG